MSIVFEANVQHLAEAAEAELCTQPYVSISQLPPMAGFDPQPDSLWLFVHDDAYEILLPAGYHYTGSEATFASACASMPQPGGFQRIAAFERAGASLAEVVEYLVGLIDPAGSGAVIAATEPAVRIVSANGPTDDGADEELSRSAAPEIRSLTDLEAVARIDESIELPTAPEVAAQLAMAVKGQPEAIATVADAVVGHLHRPEPSRPARILLVGPSGVGKTATFSALRDLLTDLGGSNWASVRIDGNQLQESHAVATLLGAPAGHVGYTEGSPLVQALATNPRTVVLFDEYDKAHPDCHTALMGMMDNGELQLRRPIGGRWTLDCRRAILLFTSNQDGQEVDDRTRGRGLAPHQVEQVARQVMVAAGTPTWIAGRHGHIAVYRSLARAAVAEILTLEIAKLSDEFGLDLQWIEPAVISHLLQQAEVEHTGARDLRSVAERLCTPAFVAHRSSTHAEPVVLTGPPIAAAPGDEWSPDCDDPAAPPD